MTQRRRLTATLIEDTGAAASDTHFFRSAPFLRAEGVTHTLVVGDGDVVLPVVRREIPGGRGHDGISPYGYPGGRCRDGAPHVDDVDFSGTGLVSLFLRERLIGSEPGGATLRGGTERGIVLLHDPAQPRTVHRRVATKVRSNERAGYGFSAVSGPEADPAHVEAFAAAYDQTMRRAQATGRYFFGADYLRECLSAEASWLAIVHGPDGDLAAAAIVAVSDGVLHYFLGGTADAHWTASPAKNLMVGMLDMADELGLPLNLGGGLSPGDSLEGFKTQFTNSARRCHTHDIVIDPDGYVALTAELASGTPSTGFFPAYRRAG